MCREGRWLIHKVLLEGPCVYDCQEKHQQRALELWFDVKHQAHIKQIREKFFCSHKMAELQTEGFCEFCSLYGSILFLAPSGCRTLLVKSGTSYFKVYIQFWDFNSLETWQYMSVVMRGMTWIAMIWNLWRRGRHGAKSIHGGHQFLNIVIARKVWPCSHSFHRVIEDCFFSSLQNLKGEENVQFVPV